MTSDSGSNLAVKPASNISYFTPAQIPPAGTAADAQSDEAPIPKLFQPLNVRGLILHNRIAVRTPCLCPFHVQLCASHNVFPRLMANSWTVFTSYRLCANIPPTMAI